MAWSEIRAQSMVVEQDVQPPHESHVWSKGHKVSGKVGRSGWFSCRSCERCGVAIIEIAAERPCPKKEPTNGE